MFLLPVDNPSSLSIIILDLTDDNRPRSGHGMSRPSVNARASSSGSQHGLSRSQLGASPNIAFPASPRKPSALPLPSLKHNRSFARLAQLFGIGKAAAAEQDEGDVSEEEEALEAEEGDEGDEGQEEVDEETLLWDAQVSCFAIKLQYTCA